MYVYGQLNLQCDHRKIALTDYRKYEIPLCTGRKFFRSATARKRIQKWAIEGTFTGTRSKNREVLQFDPDFGSVLIECFRRYAFSVISVIGRLENTKITSRLYIEKKFLTMLTG